MREQKRKKTQEQIDKYYRLGQKMAIKYNGDEKIMAWNEGDLGDWLVSYDSELFKIAFFAGFDGKSKPIYAKGWRYGDIPESGCSKNHAENKPEPGVSMMAIETEEGKIIKMDHWLSEAWLAADRQKKIYYDGWYVGNGSDGEPCLRRP